MLDLSRLRDATRPEDALAVSGAGLVLAEAQRGLARDVPKPRDRGFVPLDGVRLRGRMRTLVDEIEGPDLPAALAALFGLDLRRCTRVLSLAAHGLPKPAPGDGTALLTLWIGLEGARLSGGPRLRLVSRRDAGGEPSRSESSGPPAPAGADTFLAFRAGGAPRRGRVTEEGRVVRVEWFGDTPEERARKWRRTAQFLGAVFPR